MQVNSALELQHQGVHSNKVLTLSRAGCQCVGLRCWWRARARSRSVASVATMARSAVSSSPKDPTRCILRFNLEKKPSMRCVDEMPRVRVVTRKQNAHRRLSRKTYLMRYLQKVIARGSHGRTACGRGVLKACYRTVTHTAMLLVEQSGFELETRSCETMLLNSGSKSAHTTCSRLDDSTVDLQLTTTDRSAWRCPGCASKSFSTSASMAGSHSSVSSAAVSALLSAAESDALPPAPLLSGGKRLLASCFRAICTKQHM
jgi:hypothetical protein